MTTTEIVQSIRTLKESPSYALLQMRIRDAVRSETARLILAKPEDVQVLQGRIQGLNLSLDMPEIIVSEALAKLEGK